MMFSKTIVVDGNDGTGKSTLVNRLRKLGYFVNDRGIPTTMTDDDNLNVQGNERDVLYVILDGTVEESRKRLEEAGKDLTEKYHTVTDLTYYRQKYLEVYGRIRYNVGDRATLVHTTDKTQEEVLETTLKWLRRF